jgi:hypothetical protein
VSHDSSQLPTHNLLKARLAAAWAFQIVCATSGTRNVAATVVSGGPTTFGINPNVDFAAGELCTVTVFAAQVTDQDAVDPPDIMAANFVFSFTTDATPSVTASTPTNGAVQVASNTNLSLTFSEAVNVTGNWFQIVCASSGTRNVGDTAVSGGPTTFGINPTADFTSGEACTVTVFAAQVTDQDGNDPPDTMAANFVFSFTIDTAPSVTTTTPTNGATAVSPSTTIVVNFNESVNATTSSFTVQCPSSNQAFTLSSSPAASFTLTPTGGLPEGVICTVTVLAAQITDADAGDPPDNMLANHVFSFSIPPNANDDSRSATGNVGISTAGGSNFSVMTNDIGPGISITAFDATSVRGGVVALNTSTGTLAYSPPVGYEGIDQFTYTITNAAGSDTATVTMTISGMLWFIDDSAAACTLIANGCGRLSTPFSTLAAFNAVDGGSTTNGSDVVDPEAGDHVFIYSGTYAGGLTPENSQRIIGQGATGTLATLSGITPATDSAALPSTGGTKPTINTAGFTLAQNNQIHGIAFSGTSGAAISSAANVGTLVMSDITISNTSGGGINLTGGGTATLTGTANTIATTTGTPLNVVSTNIGAAGLTFRSISANGAVSGIVLNSTGSAGGLTVTGDGTGAMNGSGGTIQNTSGVGISLTGTRNVSLTQLNVANTGNHGLDLNSVTNFTFQDASVINAGNGNEEQGFTILNVFGTTNLIEDVRLDDITEDGIQVRQNTTDDGTMDTLTIRRLTVEDHKAGVGESGIEAQPDGASQFRLIVDDCDFTLNTNAVIAAAGSTAATHTGVFVMTIQGSTFNAGASFGRGGPQFLGGGSGTAYYTVDNNQILGTKFSGLILNNDDTQTTHARVINNTITGSGATNNGNGIAMRQDANGTMFALIDNNTISLMSASAISLNGQDATTDDAPLEFQAIITNNTVVVDGGVPSPGTPTRFGAGIIVEAGVGVALFNDLCVDVSGNQATGTNTADFFDSDIVLNILDTNATMRVRQTSAQRRPPTCRSGLKTQVSGREHSSR